jgi:hypothetical protein
MSFRIALAPVALTVALLTAPLLRAAHHEVPRTAAPENARVYIISPANGEVVNSPVKVRFGLSGMGVAPAGLPFQNTGHHHLIIDAPTPDAGAPIPNDAQHRHFGGGQTEVTIELAPGAHTLQLIVGDHNHVPHDPPIVSPRIEITVE